MAKMKDVIWIVGLLLCSSLFAREQNEYSIQYYSTSDGLSQNEVTSIVRDKYGFMWFGTRGGLNRFDGYQFDHFKPAMDANSIKGSSIERIYSTSAGNLWIGTKSSGCSHYNVSTQTFNYPSLLKDLPKRILSFCEDKQKNIWIGGWNGGLFYVDQANDTVQSYIPYSKVNCVMQARNDNMYAGTSQGLNVINNGKVQRIKLVDQSDEITDIVEDSKLPVLWVVGWNMKLVAYNYETGEVQQYSLQHNNSTNVILSYSVCQSASGNIWVGTWGHGLLKFNPDLNQTTKVELHPQGTNINPMDFRVVLDIFEDENEVLWVGTDGGGIIKISPNSFLKTLGAFNDERLRNAHVNAVLKRNNHWYIGTKGEGLFVAHENGSVWNAGFYKSDNMYNRELISARAIVEDPEKRLWISFSSGLFVLKESGNNYMLQSADAFFGSPQMKDLSKIHHIFFENDLVWLATQQKGVFRYKKIANAYCIDSSFNKSAIPEVLQTGRVTKIFKDTDGFLWFCTYSGIFRYEPDSRKFTPLNKLLIAKNGQVCDIVLCANEDSNGNLWFGTTCGLLRLFKHKGGLYEMKAYGKSSGLPDDYINGILEDNDANIWVSTNAGLSCLLNGGSEIRNFHVKDGLSGVNFVEASCYKDADGMLYFGSHTGLAMFNPSDIEINAKDPNLVFTGFKIMNKNGYADKNINELPLLSLSHKDKEISFEFASLDYKAPELNHYAYRLLGQTDQWFYISQRRHISFSNLKPGNYTLEIKGTNSNGKWSENILQLPIHMQTPPWKRWYAIVGYIVFITFLVVLISLVGIREERLKNNLKLVQYKQKKSSELNEYKLQFFTNISHEFRTPLTLISAPVSELLSTPANLLNHTVLQSKLTLVHQNTQRLLQLVNQLLEFRKVEVGKARLRTNETDFAALVSETAEMFNQLAQNKDVSFELSVPDTPVVIWLDEEKARTILFNLYSNAIKYAGKPGKVTVSMHEDTGSVFFEVCNSGEGIPVDDLKKVFDRFYRSSEKSYYGSSGIGLALVKNYVEMHGGEISAVSKAGEYTKFKLKFKKGNAHLKPAEMGVENKVSDGEGTATATHVGTDGENFPKQPVNTKTILLVEDNEEVMQYLVSILSALYQIEKAPNGKEGARMAREQKPDLILSDVMMPVMDGFEMLAKVKQDALTSDIPVILLTAKDTDEDKLFGIKHGADAYIPKPFDPVYLTEQIASLLRNRECLKNKYARRIKLDPTNKDITNEDAEFVEKVKKVIEKHIRDDKVEAEWLASEMAMSASSFYRRLKRTTQKSPGQFIRSFKMKRAAHMLTQTNMAVSQVAESVGYHDLKNFRHVFKKEFSVLPSEYRAQNKA